MHIKPPLPTSTHIAAATLRARMTDAERKLWLRLRSGRLSGFKFRRQHPIPPYVVDFFCQQAALVIELDGSQHEPDVDAVRTFALERKGLQVLRFWDNQVLTDIEAVLEEVVRIVETRTLTRRCAPPSPEGRGEKP